MDNDTNGHALQRRLAGPATHCTPLERILQVLSQFIVVSL